MSILHSVPTNAAAAHDDLPRAKHLMSAHRLHEFLGDASTTRSDNNMRLFEVACDGLDAFLHSHIPGAGYIDTQTLEAPPYWNAVADAPLLSAFAALGVDINSTVILYGRNLLAAARVAHLMLYAGVRDVRLLDGGYQAWQAAALPVKSGAPKTWLPRPFGLDAPALPQLKIDLALARARPGRALVSIRTWDEHCGRISGYFYIAAKGDIPGALWGHAGKGGDVNDMSDFQHADGTMRSAADINALWAQCGIHPHMDISFYCGTGWRASLAFFYAWVMGWERISVFDGGWFEWSSQGSFEGRGRE